MSDTLASKLSSAGFVMGKEVPIFTRYLRLPLPYLMKMSVHYRPSLRGVPAEMPTLIKMTHDHHDANLRARISKMDLKEQLPIQNYRAHGIPPMYCAENALPICSGAVMSAYQLLCERIKGAASAGKVLYFHSTMSTQCLQACAGVMKSAIDQKMKVRMVAFPEFMERATKFEKDSSIKEWLELDLVVLYMLGTEYVSQSGFTQAQLEQFVTRRRIMGRSTVLCSHLTPKEFEERYSRKLDSLCAVPLKFDDDPVSTSLNGLVKSLKLL